MKHPHTLSDSELKAYADQHLQYELDMLTVAAGILGAMLPQPPEDVVSFGVRNGLLNTFATHSRNLIDFLYSRSKGKDKPTDIVIEDYVDEATVARHLLPITPLLDSAIIKANKQVPHLTKERIDFEREGKEWQSIAVADQIVKALASIAHHVPAARISDELKGKMMRANLTIPVVDISSIRSPDSIPIGLSLTHRLREQ